MTMATKTISNSDDVIDSRKVIERIEELRAERDELIEARSEVTHDDPEAYNKAVTELANWNQDYSDELTALEALAVEASDYAPDWEYGEALIRDSHFEEFAQELADDIGAVATDAVWPYTCIDWTQAARELQMDYTQVDFDGVAYWIR